MLSLRPARLTACWPYVPALDRLDVIGGQHDRDGEQDQDDGNDQDAFVRHWSRRMMNRIAGVGEAGRPSDLPQRLAGRMGFEDRGVTFRDRVGGPGRPDVSP